MREGEIIEGGFWDGAEVISVYTRAQAIDDGVLVDLTQFDLPKEAGFKFPVACTQAVWHLIEPTDAESGIGQDFKGRMWDVLWLLRTAIQTGADSDTTRFQVYFQMRDRDGYRNGQTKVSLKAVCGPGDDPAPVITIMLPEES